MIVTVPWTIRRANRTAKRWRHRRTNTSAATVPIRRMRRNHDDPRITVTSATLVSPLVRMLSMRRSSALSWRVNQSVVAGNMSKVIQSTIVMIPNNSQSRPVPCSARCNGAFSPLGRRRRPATLMPAILPSRRTPSEESPRVTGGEGSLCAFGGASMFIVGRLVTMTIPQPHKTE